MKAKVVVMPKVAVLDPQGAAVRDAMQHLGMREVKNVRIGKYLEIDHERNDADVVARLHKLCRDLLSNPIIEDYQLVKELKRCVIFSSSFFRPWLFCSRGGLP